MGATTLMGAKSTFSGESIYDGKKLYEIFMTGGRGSTYEKLREWCRANGMYSPEKGEPSRMGPYWAMWRYAFHNHEEAYPLYERWAKEYIAYEGVEGYEPTKETFLKELEYRARRREVAKPKEYEEFCEKHGFEPKPIISKDRTKRKHRVLPEIKEIEQKVTA